MVGKKRIRRTISTALALMVLGAGGSLAGVTVLGCGVQAQVASAAAKVKPDKDGYVAKVTPIEPQTPLDITKLSIRTAMW